jgi:uncharacterized protein
VAETSEGRVGVWDTTAYTRLTDWPSHGIGPHEIMLLPGGRLVVANGGIKTDPVDRTKLNIPDMRPNLTLLDAKGALLDMMELAEMPQNSIRHLALCGGAIAFAMQWEGDPAEVVPQLGLWTPGHAPVLCAPLPEDAHAMKGYAGSIAATTDRILVTSPKGGAAMVFASGGAHVATYRRADLCGAASFAGAFTVTDGLGAVWAVDDGGLTRRSQGGTQWDNHLVALSRGEA